MQEFKTIYTIVRALQAAKGDNEKQEVLMMAKDLPYFKEYMKAVYDTVNINYYQKSVPPVKTVAATPNNPFSKDTLDQLEVLIAGRRDTGAKAKATLGMMNHFLDEEGKALLKWVIDRSIGAGVGDTMVLKTWPGLYFIPPYMRGKSMTKKLKEKYSKLDSFYVDTKRDGSFAYVQAWPEKRVITRQGSVYPDWFITRAVEAMPYNIVLMGEFEVEENGVMMKRADANGVLNSVLKGAPESEFSQYRFIYTAWDCVTHEEFVQGFSEVAREVRIDNTEKAVMFMANTYLIDAPLAASIAEANRIHIAITRAGGEGTMWKTRDGGWKNSSSGTDDMVKNKVVFMFEAEVTGYTEGEGKDAGSLGSVDMASKCGRVKFQCGSGFSAKQRKDFWEIKEQLPGKIFSIEGNDITTSRSKETFAISLPIFVDERFDKTEADDYERILEQFEAAKEGREVE